MKNPLAKNADRRNRRRYMTALARNHAVKVVLDPYRGLSEMVDQELEILQSVPEMLSRRRFISLAVYNIGARLDVLLDGERSAVIGKGRKATAYLLLMEAVRAGAEYGWMRAHKHVDHPSRDSICDNVSNGIMLHIGEIMQQEDDE